MACGSSDAPTEADTVAQDTVAPATNEPSEDAPAAPAQGATVTEAQVKAALGDDARLAMYATGDINEDGYEDAIVVADMTSDDRITYIFLQDAAGLKKHEQNAMIAMCASCGGAMGDPLIGITVKGKYFSIEHMGGSREAWTKIITFKHVGNNRFELHRDGGTVFDRMDPDAAEPVETVKTVKDFGVIAFGDYNYENMW